MIVDAKETQLGFWDKHLWTVVVLVIVAALSYGAWWVKDRLENPPPPIHQNAPEQR